jgi:hypothetical protein
MLLNGYERPGMPALCRAGSGCHLSVGSAKMSACTHFLHLLRMHRSAMAAGGGGSGGVRSFSRTAVALWASLALGRAAAWAGLPPGPQLVAFWPFQEAAGEPKVDLVSNYTLWDYNATDPVQASALGVWGPRALQIRAGQRLWAPRDSVPLLANITGKDAQVTMVAWLRREQTPAWDGGAIVAGVWNEYRKARQYALFLGLSVCNVPLDVVGHVSAVGGPTPGAKYCITRACGGTPVPWGEYICTAMSYDGQYARAYFNGSLDRDGVNNPYFYDQGIYTPSTDDNAADFTVGANFVNTTAGGPPLLQNKFNGVLGGLAIYRTALSDEQVAAACASPLNWD